VGEERALGLPVGPAEECAEIRVAVIPAHDHFLRAQAAAGSVPHGARHAQRHAGPKAVLRRHGLRHVHDAAAGDGAVRCVDLAEQQPAALLGVVGEVLQDRLAGRRRHADQQPVSGGGEQRGQWRRTVSQRID